MVKMVMMMMVVMVGVGEWRDFREIFPSDSFPSFVLLGCLT
jgi:hypothetical protein